MKLPYSHEKRLAMMGIAVANGWKKAEIARAIGTTRANLGNLLATEPKNSKYIEPLDQWLQRNAYTSPGGARPAQGDAIGDLTTLIEGFLPVARNPDIPASERLFAIEQGVDLVARLLPRIRALTERGSDTSQN